jgi:hypothetical protein
MLALLIYMVMSLKLTLKVNNSFDLRSNEKKKALQPFPTRW